jgi:hypothetical protein
MRKRLLAMVAMGAGLPLAARAGTPPMLLA